MVDPLMRRDEDVEATSGPREPIIDGSADVVWLTAESLGRDDPALRANADLPVVFVFDEPLLRRLRLTYPRLVFLSEALADLALDREVRIYRGSVDETLSDVGSVATTFTPIPGWRRIASRADIAATYPWPWLRRPHGGSVTSFTAWSRSRKTRR
jgi:deoxyribodipyrimidine photo-lyase